MSLRFGYQKLFDLISMIHVPPLKKFVHKVVKARVRSTREARLDQVGRHYF